MRIVAIIQARMGSTRLPGKVMMTLAGRTVLEHVIARVAACRHVQEIVVATTSGNGDDVIVGEAQRCRVQWYRGSEEDVLARFDECADKFGAEVVVRVTSDCPLFDPDLLCAMLDRYRALEAEGIHVDYLSNTMIRTYPRGLDAEIISREALAKAHLEAREEAEREHVTPYIWKNPHLFVLVPFTGGKDLSRYRWTLDTPEDMRVIREIYDALFSEKRIFSTAEVLDFLEANPWISTINRGIKQKYPE